MMFNNTCMHEIRKIMFSDKSGHYINVDTIVDMILLSVCSGVFILSHRFENHSYQILAHIGLHEYESRKVFFFFFFFFPSPVNRNTKHLGMAGK